MRHSDPSSLSLSNLDLTLKQALALHKADQLQPAEELYLQILRIKPDHADVLHLLGLIYGARGAAIKAKQLIWRAIEIDQHEALFYVSYGDILQRENKVTQAIDLYRLALKLNPDSVQALSSLGNALAQTGHLDAAIACYNRALAVTPTLPEVLNSLGLVHQQKQQHMVAQTCFEKSVALDPTYIEPRNNLGNLYRDLADYDNAIAQYQQALALKPDHSVINYNLALVYEKQKLTDQAVEFYRKAIEHEPPVADAHNNLGKYYQDRCQPDTALWHYDRAIALDPDHFEARFNRSLSLLSKGAFTQGWQEYEWRFKLKRWKRIYPHQLQGSRWKGNAFSGKTLLIHSEQGFGDTIWLARYLPLVKSLGGNVIFETRAELEPLLQQLPGIDQLITFSFETPPQLAYDYVAPLMSLPWLLKTTLDTIPVTTPYLKASESKQTQWAQKIRSDRFKLGLVWAAKATGDHERSCPLEYFLPLLDHQQLQPYGLQKGEDASQAILLPASLVNLGPELETFADTAGAIASLDLIISVDTAVAHLAGAMGKPVWVLLPYGADWKWLFHRDDSPWYPTMRLFRQQQPGDWKGVIQMVHNCLLQKIASERV